MDPELTRRLTELKQQLRCDGGFRASEASAVAVVSPLTMAASARQIARHLREL